MVHPFFVIKKKKNKLVHPFSTHSNINTVMIRLQYNHTKNVIDIYHVS